MQYSLHQEEERRKQEELEALRRHEEEKRRLEEEAAVAAALAQQQEEQKKREQEAQRQQELQRQRQQQQEALRRLQQQQQQQQQLAQMKVRTHNFAKCYKHNETDLKPQDFLFWFAASIIFQVGTTVSQPQPYTKCLVIGGDPETRRGERTTDTGGGETHNVVTLYL